MTRIQLQTGFIELEENIDFPIDLSFSEILKSGSKVGGMTRSIDVAGNDNNSKLLGLHFDIDLKNNTFDRNKKTECSIIQNGVEVFIGYIQLMEISRVNSSKSTNQKNVKYKITIFDEVSNLFNEIGEKELTELTFSEFTHTFGRTEIIDSWDNTSGYVYPQFAKADAIYTLRDFKLAIFEYEYFKKIFEYNGYTFTFSSYANEDIRLDKRIIPYNGKQLEGNVISYVKQVYSVVGEMVSKDYSLTGVSNLPFGHLPFINGNFGYATRDSTNQANSKIELSSIFQDAQNQYHVATDLIENKAGNGRTFSFNTSYGYRLQVRAVDNLGHVVAWKAVNSSFQVARCDVKVSLIAQSLANSNKVCYIDNSQVAKSFTAGTTTNYSSGWQDFAEGINDSTSSLGLFNSNEAFDFTIFVFGKYYNQNGSSTSNASALPVYFVDQATGNPVKLEFKISVSDLQLSAVPDINEPVSGTIIDPTVFIPKKIKQKDILSSIIKSYNLYFTPDENDAKNIIIKTRDEFYKNGPEWNWTDKFSENNPNTISFLSIETTQKQVLKYKEDKDEINTAYQSETQETYGQTTIQLDNEYNVGTTDRLIIYSPTPSIQSKINVPLPSINGGNPDNNIRVLLHNGIAQTSQYDFYDDITINPALYGFTTFYCKSSMFDNEVTPNFSILFDSPKFLFHNYQQGQTDNYLYNLHYQNEFTNINEGMKLTGYFDLTETDFQKLSKRLDYKIFIKDNGWFYISKIQGYNSGKRTLTKVTLITADDAIKLKFKKPILPNPNPSVVVGPIIRHLDTVNFDTNVIVGTGVVIGGGYNTVIGENVTIVGSGNLVQSDDVQVVGSFNNVGSGLAGLKLMGDNVSPETTGIYIGKNKVGNKSYIEVNDPYNALLTDEIINVTNPSLNIILPLSSDFQQGKTYIVKNTSSGDISISSDSLIDNVFTIDISIGQSLTVISSPTKWLIID